MPVFRVGRRDSSGRGRVPSAVAVAASSAVVALLAGCGDSTATGTSTTAGSAGASPSTGAPTTAPPATSPPATAPPITKAPPPDGVAVFDFRFTPDELVVPAGTVVTFRNDDGFEHQIERLDTGEAPPELLPGDTWTFTASTTDGATEIPYYCAIHNAMRARVRLT